MLASFVALIISYRTNVFHCCRSQMSHLKRPTESAQQYLERLLELEGVSDARLAAATEAARLAGNNYDVFIK